MELNELVENSVDLRKCFKCEHILLDNLNIASNSMNSMFVLWNKYQIFVYEDLNFESAAKIFVPEFTIEQLLVTNNHLICLDCSGNIHTIPLKFKNSAQKRFKSTFHPRAQRVLRMVQHSDAHIISLKYEFQTHSLCFHTINSDFQVDKRYLIKFDNELWKIVQNEEKQCIIASLPISDDNYEAFKSVFSLPSLGVWKDYSIIVLSVDKINVYGFIFNLRMSEEEIELVKLYTSPSEICDIKVLDNGLTIYIGLTIGTLVKLSFKENKNNTELVHLNTALYKFYIYKNIIIYTDGIAMWKAENAFKDEITFQEFFVKQVKDFIKFEDKILMTTFTKLFYIFPVENENSYLKTLSTSEYCSAEKLLSNAEYLYKIMKEIDKNKVLVERVNEVSNYLIALALANRHDLMDRVIKTKCYVYGSYNEALSKNNHIILTNKLHKYFKRNSYYICIDIFTYDLHHTLNQLLSSKFGDKKMHIVISSMEKVVITTSVCLREITNKSFLIPINEDALQSEYQLNIEIKIVTNIPGSHDESKDVWIVLYTKKQVLHSELFIKTDSNTNLSLCVKDTVNVNKLILETLSNQYSNIAEFSNEKEKGTNMHSLFIKLPNNYKVIFGNRENYPKCLRDNQLNSLTEQLNSNSFLESKWDIVFVIAKMKVTISIVNDDFSIPLLKISSKNEMICNNFRLFFSSLIYGCGREETSKEFVSASLYTITENLQKAIKTCVDDDDGFQLEDFLPLADQFQKCVIGALPL